VQCTGWGWPETSGAPALDAHLSSEALAPPGAERFFTENLVRLPHLPAYCVRPPVEAKPEPVERFGLPAGTNVYLCVQNLRKAHPDFDPVLGDILRSDPKGVVAFVHDKSLTFGELLRQRWERTLGDVLDRLLILPRLTPNDYIRLVASSHVLLDTPHFSGANTAYDAFAVGVPAVTLPGEMPRSRYTAELYRSVGIEDLISSSPQEYADIAVRLGSDSAFRNDLRARILSAASLVFGNRAAVEQLETFFAATLAGAGRRGR
jgi:predicted O-linked N-acetylglucosamine transferase (SPINDLY family)